MGSGWRNTAREPNQNKFILIAVWDPGWRFGLAVRVVLSQRSCATSDQVDTRMGDRLWSGKPSRYVTSQLGQLSIPRDGKILLLSYRAE